MLLLLLHLRATSRSGGKENRKSARNSKTTKKVGLMVRFTTDLDFDGHVLVGLCQLLVPLLEGGVAFDALLQLRFNFLRAYNFIPEIRISLKNLFMFSAVHKKVFECCGFSSRNLWPLSLKQQSTAVHKMRGWAPLGIRPFYLLN